MPAERVLDVAKRAMVVLCVRRISDPALTVGVEGVDQGGRTGRLAGQPSLLERPYAALQHASPIWAGSHAEPEKPASRDRLQ
jgi:hypothetical protein